MAARLSRNASKFPMLLGGDEAETSRRAPAIDWDECDAHQQTHWRGVGRKNVPQRYH